MPLVSRAAPSFNAQAATAQTNVAAESAETRRRGRGKPPFKMKARGPTTQCMRNQLAISGGEENERGRKAEGRHTRQITQMLVSGGTQIPGMSAAKGIPGAMRMRDQMLRLTKSMDRPPGKRRSKIAREAAGLDLGFWDFRGGIRASRVSRRQEPSLRSAAPLSPRHARLRG